MTLEQLREKEAYLLGCLEFLRMDLREYTMYPCETVDLLQLRYQYDFDLRQLKDVQQKIKFYKEPVKPFSEVTAMTIENWLKTPFL